MSVRHDLRPSLDVFGDKLARSAGAPWRRSAAPSREDQPSGGDSRGGRDGGGHADCKL